MDINVFRGIMTLVIMLLFIGLCIWVYSKKRKPFYDQAARMALDEQEQPHQSRNEKEVVSHE